MKKHLYILLLIPFACFSQTWQESAWLKTEYKWNAYEAPYQNEFRDDCIRIAVKTTSIFLEAKGDAMFDIGKETGNHKLMKQGKTIQAISTAELIGLICWEMTRPQKSFKNAFMSGLSYATLRFSLFDGFYNVERGEKFFYFGNTTHHDDMMQKMNNGGFVQLVKGCSLIITFKLEFNTEI